MGQKGYKDKPLENRIGKNIEGEEDVRWELKGSDKLLVLATRQAARV